MKQRRKVLFRRCFMRSHRPCRVLVLWNGFKCEFGNNQFQIDWCDGHSSPSAPAGCSRKRRHSRVGPRLPPSAATPHAPQPCSNNQLAPYAALWQMAASPSPFLYDSTNSRIPQYARSAIRAYAAGIMVGPSCAPKWTSSPAVHSLLHGPSREAILVPRKWRQGFNFRLSGSATRRRQRGEGDESVALMAYVEPLCFTASVCARAEPSNRALEVSPLTDNHLR